MSYGKSVNAEGKPYYGVDGEYDGSWSQDVRSGKGKMITRKGENSIYDGDWSADVRSGRGSLVTTVGATKTTYTGSWLNDVKQGKGKEETTGGYYLEGSWDNGVRTNGAIKEKNINGVFEGVWTYASKQTTASGTGTYSLDDKSKIVKGTQFTGGLLGVNSNGTGTIEYSDGGKYTGAFYNAMKHGYGSLVKDGNTTTGQWVYDKFTTSSKVNSSASEQSAVFKKSAMPNGFGKKQYPNGDTYTGDWFNGKKHGAGEMLYSNGEKYEGVWVNDMRQGHGFTTYADGKTLQGRWWKDLLDSEF